ncbi:MAG TPA: pseudouridine-5'-phosphate glycosidase [Paracoccaceae bacterium]|nr:pseudouridine-5'-phosphate glycosidase [Paracoccaceae bacterium]
MPQPTELIRPDLAPEIAEALAEGRPVVALESTIVTHGMPYPDNVGMARAVEELVRAEGALPATIALIEGRPRVGLGPEEIERLGSTQDVAKAGSQDLAALMIRGGSAGTTVSATMRIAALAGIPIFATGGIGGVHRGAETSFDISADLTELASTPVTVVSAGAKSILDIPKTLELLETARVPVIGFGTDAFPAFFARESGAAVPHRLDRPEEVARLMQLHRQLGSGTGILVANPVPEEAALAPAEIDGIIATALAEASARGIAGKAVTPFLLARIAELSGGRSLKANIALMRANAVLAARIACAHAALGQEVPR